MRSTARTYAFLLAVVVSAGLSTPVAAVQDVHFGSHQELEAAVMSGEGIKQTTQVCYWNGTTRKLGRGLANVVSAPLEMIRTPYFVGQQDGGLSSLTVGLVQGIGATIVRELAGIVEVVTFFAPVPKKDFQPLIHPEFVYGHGDWLP